MKNVMMLLQTVGLLSVIGILTLPAFAQEKSLDQDQKPSQEKWMKYGPCGLLNLSDSQKKEIKEERFKFEDKRIDLESAEHHARLNFMRIASNEKSSEGDIQKAAEEVASSMSKLITSEELFKANVLTKILKPEQRENALKCGMLDGFHRRGGPNHGPHGQMGKDTGEGIKKGPKEE
jgi:hypothetical protein